MNDALISRSGTGSCLKEIGQTNASFEILLLGHLPPWLAKRMARASGSPLILVILVITSFRLQVQVLGKLEHTSQHVRGHGGNLA